MIGQDTIERVRDATNLVALVGETVKLTRRGRSWTGLCPFHKEKSPSFHVNEERGFYHCFGCAAHGDAIKFVQEVEGLPFHEAVRQLADRASIQITEVASDAERRSEETARRRLQELYDVGAQAATYFEQMLREHPLRFTAEAELERRGLVPTSPTDGIADALQAFRIGYAPYGWDGLVRHLKQPSALANAEKVGLLAPRKSGTGYYDRFRHRLMFAVLDVQGRVVAFSGRVLEEPSESDLAMARLEPMGMGGDRDAKYVNSSESPIYRKRETVFGLYQARQEIRQAENCVVVEGNFDVVGLHARGIRNVVAPLGTAFTSEQAKLVRRFSPTVTFLFDGDRAGRAAVTKSREPCREVGLVARVANLPDGVDPDDLARKGGAAAVRSVLKASKGMLEHLLNSAFEEVRAATDPELRATRIKEIGQLLAAEDDPAVRAMAEQHADAIVSRLGISDGRTFRALTDLVKNAAQASAPPLPASASSSGPSSRRVSPSGAPPGPSTNASPEGRTVSPWAARSRSRQQEVALGVLGALLDFPDLFADESVTSGLSLVEDEVALAVVAVRQCWEIQRNSQDPQALRRFGEQVLAKVEGPIHKFVAGRLAVPRSERLEDARGEILSNLEKLRKSELARQGTEVVQSLQRAQATGDVDQELALLQQRQEIMKQRAQELLRRVRERDGNSGPSPAKNSPASGEPGSES